MSDLDTSLATLNSAVQFAAATAGASDDKDFIRKENEKAREFTVEMWNKANEYNSPIQQMNRLQAAGLNPALVYGEGAKTLADYVSAPGHSAPNMNSKDISKTLDFLGPMSVAQQMKINRQIADSNVEVNNSLIKKQGAEELQADANASKSYAEANKLWIEGKMLSSNYETYLEQELQKLEALKNENKISAKEFEIKQQELLKQIEEVRAAAARANTAEEETKTQKAQTGYVEAKTKTEGTIQDKNKAEAGYYRSAKVAADADAYKKRMEGNFSAKQVENFEKIVINPIVAKTDLDNATAWKLAEEAVSIKKKSALDWWITTVRDKYGTNVPTIIVNHVREWKKGFPSFNYDDSNEGSIWKVK